MDRVKNVFAQVGKVSDALAFYEHVLETKALFVDGERWAQFKHGDLTLALAGEDDSVDGAGGGWVVTLEVTDLDAAANRVIEAGGSLVLRRDMGTHGLSVIMRDPTGNLLTLWRRG